MQKWLFWVSLVVVLSGCARSYERSVSKNVESSPVSVMEDQNVDKIGNMVILSKDIEKTRDGIYELVKSLNGYIYYENYKTINVDQHSAEIKIALYNDTFLDCYNSLRKFGQLVSSEIVASLDSNVQNGLPELEGETKALNIRSSSISINISQNARMGNYTNVVISGLIKFFNIAIPFTIAAAIIIVVCIIGFFICYIAFYGLIVKVFKRIKRFYME